MPPLLVATGNRSKYLEFCRLLEPSGHDIIMAGDIAELPEIQETGTSFAENAVIKAVAVATCTGHPVFSDDSGLEVDALGGDPGIHSARYGGPGLNDAERMALVLERLKGHQNRAARFTCAIAVATPDGVIGSAQGAIEGLIAEIPCGASGFGYDPIFIPTGYSQTFAELGPVVKATLSHRAVALKEAISAGLFDIVGKPMSSTKNP